MKGTSPTAVTSMSSGWTTSLLVEASGGNISEGTIRCVDAIASGSPRV
jgi:hypothetical protein